MSLIVDHRDELKGQPGVHVLIGAVDSYPHLEGGVGPRAPRTFGFGQLSSSVATALNIASLLRDLHLPVPLTTIRLLASASGDVEAPVASTRCTLDDFLSAAADWRRDAMSHPDNMTWVYLVGHGLEMSTQLFLTEDFGNGRGALLRHAVDVNSIVNGMAMSRAEAGMARTQLYFLDLSRQPASQLNELQWQNATSVFDAALPGFDERDAPVFYAAEAGRAAFGLVGGTTLFSQALIECFKTAHAAVKKNGRWCITSASLGIGLNLALSKRVAEFGIQQRVAVAGSVRGSIVCYLDSAPLVDVRVMLESSRAAGLSQLEVRSDSDAVLAQFEVSSPGHPIEFQLQPGVYRFTVTRQSTEGSNPGVTSQLAMIVPPFIELFM